MGDRTISRNNFGPHARIHQGNLNITYEGDTTYNYSALPSNGLSKRAGEDDILRRLYTSPYEDRKDRNPPRVPGTCEWFTSHALFNEWQKSKSSRLLWVSADPGCGKSVLVKHLVDSVLQTTESRTVCYFFFKDDFPDQRNVISALCCILRQLFMQKPLLFSDKILHQFIAGGETFANSFSNLWKTLIQTSMNPSAGEIICIFDAIDECGDTGRSQLAQELCKLYGAGNNCHLKFLLTSRPYGKIHRGFQPLEIPGLPVIHLSGESENEAKKISQEIDIFIQFKVKDIRQRLKLTKEEHDLLLQKLMQITNRTYLWVYLTLDLIMRDISIDKTRITQATSFIPETVDEAYDKILRKSYDTDKTKKILHIIVGAVRPLNLKEMNLALVLQSSHRSSNDLDLKPEARFRQELRDICGLFITIIDSKIYLLHQTAKEFLLQDAANPKAAHEGYTWKHSLNLHESHLILSNICIWYLILLEDDENHRNETGTLRLHAEDKILFLDYSARYWATHFRELHTKIQEEKTELILKICDIESILCRMWFKIYWESTNTKFPDGFTNLMIASYFGLPTVVRNLLEGDIDLNSQDSTYQRSALSWAARNGFNVIAKLLIRGAPRFKLKPIKPLLRKRAEVDLADAYGRTPLSYAVWSGNTDMVRLLIQAGAQVHLKDELGATPLSYAILNQKEQITEILLQKGDQADVEDDLNNLLFSAVIKRREEEVEQLLKSSKVNPNTKDQTNWTPLLYTAQYGDAAIATLKALLEKGADPNCKDNNGQTPLLHAARFGDVATSKALLEHGADPNCKDNDHLTALLYAAMDGNVEISKALLEKGADPNCKYKFDWTPLIYAAEKAHVETVKVLLEKGADPNCKSKLGWTPLIYAATNGDVEILKALLENGADPNHTNNFNQTPLSCATKHHHKAAVKALLEGGAESSHGS